MSKTIVRGLGQIEDLGLYGPMTISELSRRGGVHVSIVSRTVAMIEPEGWIIRVDGPGPVPRTSSTSRDVPSLR